MDISIKDFIFCDDIRTEEGRKFSVMGIYNDKLRIVTKTTNIIPKLRVPISAFIRFQCPLDTKVRDYNFVISLKWDKKDLGKIEGTLNFGTDTFTSVPLSRVEVEVEKPGIVSFDIVVKSIDGLILLKQEETLQIIYDYQTNTKSEG